MYNFDLDSNLLSLIFKLTQVFNNTAAALRLTRHTGIATM